MTEAREVVLVTGASGSIGGALSNALAERFQVVGLVRKCKRPATDCVLLDASSEESVQKGLEAVRQQYGGRIASVIHLAAFYDFSGEPDPRYEEVNVQGTARLLQALQPFDVEQFIYASTMLVHAPTRPGVPIDEDWPLDPKWVYPQSKRAAEEVVRRQHGHLPYVILRLAGIYTDRGHVPTLAQQIQRIYEQQPIGEIFPGDPSHGQAFLHLSDLVRAFCQLVERRRQLPPDLTLLLGEPETVSYGELQAEIGRLLHGRPYPTHTVPKALAKTGTWIQEKAAEAVPDAVDQGWEPFIKPWMVDLADDHYELDIQKAKVLLGWQPERSLRQTIPLMIKALQEDPAAWYRENRLDLPEWLKTEQRDRPPGYAPYGAQGSAAMTMGGAGMEMQGHAALAADAPQGLAGDDSPDQVRMIGERHLSTLWAHFAGIVLGVWLLTSPFALGYLDMDPGRAVVNVTVERGLAPIAARNLAMLWSDVTSGALIVLFGMLSLSQRHRWAQWGSATMGLWLLFAPLVFWAPSPVQYLNNTLVGTLVIAFAVLVPMMPGMRMKAMMEGPDIPPGWSYCPSTWLQRLPLIVLAFAGFLIARHLTAYQMGYLNGMWDPFFSGMGAKNGTETVITSSVSKAWPIPDAGLGAVTYILEALMAMMGGKRRWRTMPWMVTAFLILVVPLGVISIFFIIIQPIVIGTWCTLCLLAALAMLIMIPYSLDELVAMGQFLLERRRAGAPFWPTFLKGDVMEGGAEDCSPNFDAPLPDQTRASVRGVTLPWTLLLSTVIGIGLMLTRLLFDTEGAMADSDHLVGSLIVTTSIIALAEVARPVRFVNVLLGAWLVVAPFVLSGITTPVATWAGVVSGLLVILLAMPRGAIREVYGSWSRYIF